MIFGFQGIDTMSMQFLKLCEEGELDQLSACSLEGVDGRVRARAFVLSCCNGHLDTSRWIYSLGDVDIHTKNDHAFRWSCVNGHLETAQWIYSLGDVNIHTKNDHAFRWSCVNGHLETAQWIYSLGDVNIHILDDYAFRWSCDSGHLEIAQWIYSLGTREAPGRRAPEPQRGLGEMNIHARHDHAFRWSCVNGHLETAQWIYSLGDVNIHTEDDHAFRECCINRHLEIAQWLMSLCKQYKVVIENNRIMSYSVIDEINELMKDREYEDVCEKLNITQTTTTALSECIICYDCEDEKVLKLTCCAHGHVYCVKCLYNWFKKNPRKCVLCQSQFEWSDCKILTEQ
jgi:hypothetical protein